MPRRNSLTSSKSNVEKQYYEQKMKDMQIFIDEHKAQTIDLFDKHLGDYKEKIELQTHELTEANQTITKDQ